MLANWPKKEWFEEVMNLSVDTVDLRKFYSDFNTVSLLCLSCCLLLV